MSDGSVVPTPDASDLPTFKVLAGGKELTGEYHVLSITVIKEANRIPSASLVLLDGDAAEEDFKISNTDVFLAGKEVEIHAGYHSKDALIFKGIVTGCALRAGRRKASQLAVELRDKAVKMTLERKCKYYFDSTDGDIISSVISGYGLTADVEATGASHKEMVKFYATDWDFIVSRADVNGRLVIVDDAKVSVKSPDAGASPSLTLRYGSTLLEFDAGMDARDQASGAKSFSWDASSQEMTEAEGEDGGITGPGNVAPSSLASAMGSGGDELRHGGGLKKEELKAWASSRMVRSRLSKITGRARCQGFADVKPGSTVEIKGVGERFSGTAFVSGVRHEITSANWETDIQLGLSGKWFYENCGISGAPASGLLPPVCGLQIGVVTKLEGDPDGEDRVQVKMPVVDASAEGVWARVVTLDAGEERGSFFRPELGDEVVLGFLSDDPRHPVVLGMMNSSAKPAPLKASDQNPQKGIFTRSKMKFVFDDEKKSVHVETPGGNMITLSDDEKSVLIKDLNGNKIEMASSGITIESAKEIKIKASTDVSVEGVNVSKKASAAFKAEGGSGAELKSGGATAIKGSVVQIN